MIVVLLALIVTLTTTGWLMLTPWMFGVAWLEDMHRLVADILLVAVTLHIVGVIVVSVLTRDNLVRDMLRGSKRISPEEVADLPTQPRFPRSRVRQGVTLLAALALSGFLYGWSKTAGRGVLATSENQPAETRMPIRR